MNQDQTIPIIQSVLHPTDFSEGSKVAFYHALKAALMAKSELTLLHVAPDVTPESVDFPGVRETLERWGLLPRNSARSAVADLGLKVRKIVARESHPVTAVLGYLEEHPADWIVLATHQRENHLRWLDRSVSEPIARKAAQMTLFIPATHEGFVSAEDGSVSLKSVLIPVAGTPRPQAALEAAARLVEGFSCPQGTFTIVHVGQPDTMPTFRCPEVPGWEWRKELRSGEVIQTIDDAARDVDAELIVMATDGRNGFLDGLRGSHSERLIRHGAAPMVTVPVGSLFASHLR